MVKGESFKVIRQQTGEKSQWWDVLLVGVLGFGIGAAVGNYVLFRSSAYSHRSYAARQFRQKELEQVSKEETRRRMLVASGIGGTIGAVLLMGAFSMVRMDANRKS